LPEEEGGIRSELFSRICICVSQGLSFLVMWMDAVRHAEKISQAEEKSQRDILDIRFSLPSVDRR
jgi:hypothetical protein